MVVNVSNYFQMFQNEIYSRQQILHAIIAEGRQMIRAGDVDDYGDFEHKLNTLEDQWHSVLRRSQQRRVVIDNLLHQWQAYRDNLEQINHRLDLVSESISDVDAQMAPLQKISNLHSTVKVFLHYRYKLAIFIGFVRRYDIPYHTSNFVEVIVCNNCICTTIDLIV